jgi:hypothetical protein
MNKKISFALKLRDKNIFIEKFLKSILYTISLMKM